MSISKALGYMNRLACSSYIAGFIRRDLIYSLASVADTYINATKCILFWGI
jgi:hypothetical protein